MHLITDFLVDQQTCAVTFIFRVMCGSGIRRGTVSVCVGGGGGGVRVRMVHGSSSRGEKNDGKDFKTENLGNEAARMSCTVLSKKGGNVFAMQTQKINYWGKTLKVDM